MNEKLMGRLDDVLLPKNPGRDGSPSRPSSKVEQASRLLSRACRREILGSLGDVPLPIFFRSLLASALSFATALPALAENGTPPCLHVPGAYQGWKPAEAPVLNPVPDSGGKYTCTLQPAAAP